MINSSSGHIAVVANDAGAAAHIFAWLKTGLLNIEKCKFCLDGPAAKLFKIQQPNIRLFSIEKVFTGAEKLLSGTGWSSSLEHDARALAKNSNIESIAVIDHWVNYRERFVRDRVEILPDVIWVTDKYAFKEAKRCFPQLEIIEQENRYLKSQVQEVLRDKLIKKEDVTNVLYVLEPIRDSWAGNKVLGEFQALDFFLEKVPDLDLGKDIAIVLKPHPSDPIDKYDKWLKLSKISNICIVNDKNLSNLIAWSDVVVGCETYAMVVAVNACKRVISSLPMHAHNCRLPYEKIERLNQLT